MSYFVFAAVVLAAGVAGEHLGGHIGFSAPWWVWSLLTAVVVGMARLDRLATACGAHLKGLAEARRELQSWEASVRSEDSSSSEEVHFPSFLLRVENVSGGDQWFRIYDVRRTAEGLWQRRLCSGASILMNRRHERIMHRLRPDDRTRDDEFDKEATTWEAFGYSTLELAYQRFIHAQDVPIDDGVYDRWHKEADDMEKREQAREAKRELSKTSESVPA